MVGEIRDAEVAQIVGQAAYTGRLVLSSMHTLDAATAITRLTNLGFQPFKTAECLSAVLAQRLLRSLCPYCKNVNTTSEARRLGAEHQLSAVPAFVGPGCEHCRHTGYGARVPIAELLTPSDALREAIVGGGAARDIRAAMRASGTPTMRDHAMRFVSEGLTSIDEVNRVLSEDVDGAESPGHIQSRVLIADDEPVARMLVRGLLERENFQVLEAANGKQAVDIAMRERPDLMIIDLNMPEMDGYEAIARLRRDITVAATLPIMVLTSEEGPTVEGRVLALGADDYIVKPFDPTVLLSRVNAVFRRLESQGA
jgi:CheY-like chemotaxis protein